MPIAPREAAATPEAWVGVARGLRPGLDVRSAAGVAQVRQGGEDAAMLGGAGLKAELVEDGGDVLLHGGVGHHQRLGDPRVGLPLRQEAEHLALTWRQLGERSLATAPAEHPADHLRIERAAAACDASDRVRERVDIADALLEQVAHALRAVADQIKRVLLLV